MACWGGAQGLLQTDFAHSRVRSGQIPRFAASKSSHPYVLIWTSSVSSTGAVAGELATLRNASRRSNAARRAPSLSNEKDGFIVTSPLNATKGIVSGTSPTITYASDARNSTEGPLGDGEHAAATEFLIGFGGRENIETHRKHPGELRGNQDLFRRLIRRPWGVFCFVVVRGRVGLQVADHLTTVVCHVLCDFCVNAGFQIGRFHFLHDTR